MSLSVARIAPMGPCGDCSLLGVEVPGSRHWEGEGAPNGSVGFWVGLPIAGEWIPLFGLTVGGLLLGGGNRLLPLG
jgi:hypothetical protein